MPIESPGTYTVVTPTDEVHRSSLIVDNAQMGRDLYKKKTKENVRAQLATAEAQPTKMPACDKESESCKK